MMIFLYKQGEKFQELVSVYYAKMFELVEEMGWPETNKSDYDKDIITTWQIFTTLTT